MALELDNIVNKRLQWLDIAKGITIILMVLGHTSLPKVVSDFIFAFHMPLFFIASGLTTNFNRGGQKYFIINKLKKLMIPFAIYSAIVLCLKFFLLSDEKHTFTHWLTFGWEGYALWFIPVLFLAIIIASIVINNTSSYSTMVCVFALTMVGATFSYLDIYLPWTLATVPYASALIIVGHLIKPYIEYMSYYRWIVMAIGFIITIVVSHFFRLDMAWNKITPVSILSIGAVAGTMMIFSISQLIESRTKLISTILSAVGKETYLILAFSQITIMLLKRYTDLGSLVRYAILVVVIVVVKYMKESLGYMTKKK